MGDPVISIITTDPIMITINKPSTRGFTYTIDAKGNWKSSHYLYPLSEASLPNSPIDDIRETIIYDITHRERKINNLKAEIVALQKLIDRIRY